MKNLLLLLLNGLLLLACSDFLEEDISEQYVEIISPRADTIMMQPIQEFAWKELEGATSYHFILVAPSFKSASSCLADTIMTAKHFSYMLSPGSYEWSVQGVNSALKSMATQHCLTIVSP